MPDRHPTGLRTLFLTEMWERFSYYGMRALLILYITAPTNTGGLGFADARAANLYGTYTGSVWAAAIVGGIIADRWLGQFRSVLAGGAIIATGHFLLAVESLTFFYAGLACIVAGTGLLKPNVSTLVGSLYPAGDPRRDAGFSIFYMGINLGAFLGPLVTGWMAMRVGWRAGFAVAGVGMLFGLVQLVLGRHNVVRGGTQPVVARSRRTPIDALETGRSTSDAARIAAVCVFFVFAAIFWGAYEQAGSTLNLFADRYTRLSVFGVAFPAAWLQSVPPLFVITLAPLFAWLWTRLGDRQPSSPAKFGLGLLFAGLAFLVLVPAGAIAQGGTLVSPLWLVAAYFVLELGELCLSPVGLSVVTKLAPIKLLGLMMGVWFLSNAAGNLLAGWAAGFISTLPLTMLFGTVSVVTLAAAALLALLTPTVRRLMGSVA